MLCSGAELGLSADADGILILPADTPIGVAARRTSSATSCWTSTSSPTAATRCRIIGLAREVAAATGATVRWPAIEVAGVGRRDGATTSGSSVEDPRCARASSAASSTA